MKVKKISFPISLTTVKDIYDDNIDVFVKLENNLDYTVVVITHKNIKSLMDRDKSNFFGPTEPLIIVTKLTMEIIQEAIQAYADLANGHWLKLSHFASSIDFDEFEKLEKHKGENKLNSTKN